MEENLKRLGVGGHDDELTDSSVEGLGGLISTLLELLVVGSLLNKVENLVGQLGGGERECFWVDSFNGGSFGGCLWGRLLVRVRRTYHFGEFESDWNCGKKKKNCSESVWVQIHLLFQWDKFYRVY